MFSWLKTLLFIKKIGSAIAMVIAAIYLVALGKKAGVKQSQEKIGEANKRAEEIRDNVEDRVRNTPDTVVDDELDPFVRD